jgi:2'-5' RNA ligase
MPPETIEAFQDHGEVRGDTVLQGVVEAEGLFDELRELFGAHAAFTFELPRVARFPDVAWLAPDPDEPFRRLIAAIVARYPDYPPYEGIHDEVIPHLTVAEGDVELQDRVEAALAGRLPIAGEAREVALLAEDESGWWRRRERFRLSTGSGSQPAG